MNVCVRVLVFVPVFGCVYVRPRVHTHTFLKAKAFDYWPKNQWAFKYRVAKIYRMPLVAGLFPQTSH